MSKVRINDLAREMEVKSRQILDVLAELGLGEGKTHSSSLEEHEAEKVRAQFAHGSRGAGQARPRAAQGVAPKIDLSHVSKPGDVMKAILARKQEAEAEARKRNDCRSHGAGSAPREACRARRNRSAAAGCGPGPPGTPKDCAAGAACAPDCQPAAAAAPLPASLRLARWSPRLRRRRHVRQWRWFRLQAPSS